MADAVLTEDPAEAAGWPGPIGRPHRRHWWSIQDLPPGAPITARRAYAEVLGVFAAFFAASIVIGAESLARRYPAPSGSWAAYIPAAVDELGRAAIVVALVLLMSGRRGITPRMLGLGLPRRPGGGAAVGSTFRMGVWAMMALLAGGIVTAVTRTGKFNLPAQVNGPFLLYASAGSVVAGLVEETVVLAFVVTTLRQARRPLPEIVAVAVLLRCSYHDYYGPGVLGIVVWASVFIWLFLRTGSVIPLIVVHVLWDMTQFFGLARSLRPTVEVLTLLALLLLPLAAGISWLVEVLNRRPPRPPQPYPFYGSPGGGEP
jgi:membrane protease YdiL (CAAX protease family)